MSMSGLKDFSTINSIIEINYRKVMITALSTHRNLFCECVCCFQDFWFSLWQLNTKRFQHLALRLKVKRRSDEFLLRLHEIDLGLRLRVRRQPHVGAWNYYTVCESLVNHGAVPNPYFLKYKFSTFERQMVFANSFSKLSSFGLECWIRKILDYVTSKSHAVRMKLLRILLHKLCCLKLCLSSPKAEHWYFSQ